MDVDASNTIQSNFSLISWLKMCIGYDVWNFMDYVDFVSLVVLVMLVCMMLCVIGVACYLYLMMRHHPFYIALRRDLESFQKKKE